MYSVIAGICQSSLKVHQETLSNGWEWRICSRLPNNSTKDNEDKNHICTAGGQSHKVQPCPTKVMLETSNNKAVNKNNCVLILSLHEKKAKHSDAIHIKPQILMSRSRHLMTVNRRLHADE